MKNTQLWEKCFQLLFHRLDSLNGGVKRTSHITCSDLKSMTRLQSILLLQWQYECICKNTIFLPPRVFVLTEHHSSSSSQDADVEKMDVSLHIYHVNVSNVVLANKNRQRSNRADKCQSLWNTAKPMKCTWQLLYYLQSIRANLSC